MAKLPPIKRLIVEEFDKEYRSLLQKLLYPVNQFFESVSNSLNNSLTFSENFAAQELDIEITAPISPSNSTNFKSALRGPCKGIICTRVEDLTIPTDVLSSAPFVQFNNDSNQITIINVTGLTATHKYRLHLVAFS
jgi:hypothetical protein